MNNEKIKILVTGGSGLVGSAIKEISINYKHKYQFIFMSSKNCDLTNYCNTYNYFSNISPDYVIHLAANVGGLYKNINYKVDMLEKNLSINFKNNTSFIFSIGGDISPTFSEDIIFEI